MAIAKITSKINHDSMWVKVQFVDGEASVRVNRYSSSAKAKFKNAAAANRVRVLRDEMFDYMNSEEEGTYGEKLRSLVKMLSERYKK
jgi:hypothetical protein